MKPLLTLCLLCAVVSAPAQAADFYRWVDANGVTHYSQTPPPNRETDQLEPPPPPAEAPPKARERLDAQLQKLDERREERELEAEAEHKAQEAERIRQQNCRIARSNLENLEIATNSLMRLPDGSYERMDEETRQAKMEEARRAIEKYCE